MYESINTELKSILPAVISGGRPALNQRKTGRLLNDLHGVTATPIWVVRESDAKTYEVDEHEIVIIPEDWAHEYAKEHWLLDTPPEPNGFYGAFVGREYACKIAEERGYSGIFQLDDNITRLEVFNQTGHETAMAAGGIALFADVFSTIIGATNGRMVGAFLSSCPTLRNAKVARTGFPYSCFVEKLGDGRESWFGPYEDDIIHAIQYGIRHDMSTALVVSVLRYKKETSSNTGMRQHYNHDRAVALNRLHPELAKISLMMSKSSGTGGPRIFHKMRNDAIRNPLIVRDRELFLKVKERLEGLQDHYHKELHEKRDLKLERWKKQGAGL